MLQLAEKSTEQFMLSTETFNQVNEILRELVTSTRSDFALFCDANGNPITHHGKQHVVNLSGLSALAAGNFAATSEMARVVGEKEGFKFIFQEGERRNLFLCNVGFNFLLAIIFDKAVALGLVRIFANKAVESLKQVLDKAAQAEKKASDFIDSEFGLLLGKELDKSFKL
ncbi:roadblock/LC7 domain-containing protein [candidate division KSB1 bacterium]|nr:roadblock/LC7 domain-containing protein [candidate division KSB1 bacterium]